ncbi:hypothetical protein IFM89_000194 [Coptis chinensis]|uniref:HAT C-terminal dimerisation domain-containing protein n=1 Tax=Coptis chinensis TaxID=261450 RepID=A0A835M6G0_9MAGN|nr:hypothetical protein IFM89_000194 [Coptis chinensis]
MEVYLEEGIYVGCDGTFDVLNWLQSAFSAAGRVIDDYRSSLSAETKEALACTRDWLQTEFGIGKSVNGPPHSLICSTPPLL